MGDQGKLPATDNMSGAVPDMTGPRTAATRGTDEARDASGPKGPPKRMGRRRQAAGDEEHERRRAGDDRTPPTSDGRTTLRRVPEKRHCAATPSRNAELVSSRAEIRHLDDVAFRAVDLGEVRHLVAVADVDPLVVEQLAVADVAEHGALGAAPE